jgi:hypothetical protein
VGFDHQQPGSLQFSQSTIQTAHTAPDSFSQLGPPRPRSTTSVGVSVENTPQPDSSVAHVRIKKPLGYLGEWFAVERHP